MATNVPPPPGLYGVYLGGGGSSLGAGGGGGGYATLAVSTTYDAQAALQEARDQYARLTATHVAEDGSAGIWGDNAPTCSQCPLYVPYTNGRAGACMASPGEEPTVERVRHGCAKHPVVSAVMNLRQEQGLEDYIARKIIDGK